MKSLQDLLKSIGLTSFDARVYITLLSLGGATLATLEEELETHRAQLHGSLKRLFSKGLIELYGGKPAMYRAVPPDVLLEVLRRELDEDLKEAESFLRNLPRKAPESVHGVWIYRSSKGLLKRYMEAIEKAERNIIVCGDVDFVQRLREKILEVSGKGVISYVLIYEIPGLPFSEGVAEGLKKVKKSVSGDLLVLVDSKTGVLAQRRFRADKMTPYGVVVEEPVLIDYLEENFINRWIHSRTVRDEELAPPFCLTTFKLAVLEVERLLKRGLSLRVECKGRWKGGGRDHLNGRVERAVYDLTSGIVQLQVKTDGGTFTVGAPDAIVEDFACEEICVEV
ncbi:TrmB family transcriptional regulator [Infirmifilum sp. NZ]|uniref:TrmB family transcriptional regulator n=1 Tax=Infirmifilum sp. NZ TaxID=2926850 RepID=UPI00279A3447|nr:TrmB family transcriptional regulator [Infirmifilum sp. NZ]UNQ73728.1 TrmB family transcriptional regulator [Infirmifilum sp. NZ]